MLLIFSFFFLIIGIKHYVRFATTNSPLINFLDKNLKILTRDLHSLFNKFETNHYNLNLDCIILLEYTLINHKQIHIKI